MNWQQYSKTEPFRFQEEIVDKSWDKDYYGLFLEQGTGKTKIAIDTINRLMLAGKIQGAVIVCPKSLIFNWTKNEIPKHSKIQFDDDSLLVTNYENLKNVEGFLNAKPSILILDESSKIKNRRSQRTVKLLKLSKIAKYKRLLSGTPVTQGVQDLFSQLEFLKKDLLGNYYQFKYHYLITKRMSIGTRSFDKIVGYKNIEQLHKILDTFCSRVLKTDVLELPSKIYDRVMVDMTSEQRSVYNELRQNMIVEYEDNVLTTPEVITRLLRLQQIAGGFMPTDDGEMIAFDPNPKINALMDILNPNEKTVIWCRFIAEIKAIQSKINKEFGDGSAVTFIGENTPEERFQSSDSFQNGDSKVFIGNPQTGGMGLTLTSSSRVIYFSNDFSLENRLQSEDRTHRIGQKNPVTYTDLVCNRSIDSYVLQALRNKRNVSEAATDFVGASIGIS